MHLPLSQPTRRRAFTLLELLVVITIISILVGVSLPIFSRVQDRARTTQCISNLRQIAIGVLAYGADHEGKLVPVDSPTPTKYTWMTYLSNGGYVPSPTSPSLGVATKEKSVFRCPADSKTVATGIPSPASRTDPLGARVVGDSGTDENGQTVYYHVSYAMNGCTREETKYPLTRDPADGGEPTINHRLGDIPFPTKTVLACDGVYFLDGIDGRLNLRHGGKTQVNLVFMDGHAGTFLSKDVPLVSATIGADYPRFRIDYSDPVTGL